MTSTAGTAHRFGLGDLENAVVIVTGASSGIGQATARALFNVGARPVLAARRTDRLADLAAQLDGALAVPTDVTDPNQCRALIERTVDIHGRLDGLVNNAGAAQRNPQAVSEINLQDFGSLLQLNVLGSVHMLQAAVPIMERAHRGCVVNISSGTTRMTPVDFGAYAATKAALNMLSKVAREELQPAGITVSVVLPSTTATEFGGGRYQVGVENRPGFVGHRPEYVAEFVLRALRDGEAEIDIPHGPENTQAPSAS